VLERSNKGSPAELQAALLNLLADPRAAELSNREIGRRLNIDHKFVAGFRDALEAVAWAPTNSAIRQPGELGPSFTGLPIVLGGPPSGTRSTPGHTVAGEPPALNSYDCWVKAKAVERTQFVDAVGLDHLLTAAPVDHRDAFLRRIGGAA